MARRIKILWTTPAETDLAEILNFLRGHSPQAARKIVARIREDVQLLSEFPELGKLFELAQPPAREIVVGHYRIFYDYASRGRTILILAVFDSRQNPRKIFQTIARGRTI